MISTGGCNGLDQFWLIIGIRLEDNLIVRKCLKQRGDDLRAVSASGRVWFPSWFASQWSGRVGDDFVVISGRGGLSQCAINGRITCGNQCLFAGQPLTAQVDQDF